MQNLELKARYHDLEKAAELAETLGATHEWTRQQIDIYFRVPAGKLKLRCVNGHDAELIAYQRPAVADAKVSDYIVHSEKNADSLERVLSHILPVEARIVKQRTLYLWNNVRIHLDHVEQLGVFIEFEAVLGKAEDVTASRQRIEFLSTHFAIQKKNLVTVGYFELLKDVI